MRFSFVTVDDATDPPSLVVGEYGNRRQTRRLAEVPLDGGPVDGSTPARRGPRAGRRPRRRPAATSPPPTARGAGLVWVGEPGGFREHRRALPMGPEDLAYDAARDRLWTVTEHPGRRWVVSMRRSAFE